MHAKHKLSLMNKFNIQFNLTLSLDAWTNVSGNRIYAILLLCGKYFKKFLEIIELRPAWYKTKPKKKEKNS